MANSKIAPKFREILKNESYSQFHLIPGMNKVRTSYLGANWRPIPLRPPSPLLSGASDCPSCRSFSSYFSHNFLSSLPQGRRLLPLLRGILEVEEMRREGGKREGMRKRRRRRRRRG